MKKVKLVEDWKDAWRWWSTQIITIATGLVFAAPLLERYLQERVVFYIVGAILLLALLARMIQQPKLEERNARKQISRNKRVVRD